MQFLVQIRIIPSEEIVPGDIVLLSAGNLIPADGILLEAKDFYVSQAILTGETYPVEKSPGISPENAALVDRNNCVFMGTCGTQWCCDRLDCTYWA